MFRFLSTPHSEYYKHIIIGTELYSILIIFIHSLRELNFGDCLIKTDGAYMFAEALEEAHSDLEVLDLGFNEINYDGGLALIAAIQNKPKLRVLNLDGNCFGSEGTLKIIEQMSTCPNPKALQSLDEVVSEEEEEENDDQDDNQQSNDEDEEDTIEYGEEDEYGDDDDEDGDYDPNDTTEEVDEADEEYGNENSAEETAYVTTNTFPNQVREPIEIIQIRTDELLLL